MTIIRWSQGIVIASTRMLPATVRVKMSSEAAGTITLTRVAMRDVPIEELIGTIAAVCGPDAERVRHLLRAGTVVRDHVRWRWDRVTADAAAVEALLNTTL